MVQAIRVSLVSTLPPVSECVPCSNTRLNDSSYKYQLTGVGLNTSSLFKSKHYAEVRVI